MIFSTEAFQCPKDQKKIVAEFLKEEFSGRRLQARSSCMVQANFSFIKLAHDPPSEETIENFWVKQDSLVIEKVEISDTELQLYTAHFQVQVSKDQGKTWSDYRDVIKYMSNQNQAGRCALLLQSPQVLLIDSHCFNDKD